MSSGLTLIKQSVCGSAAEDNNSTKEVTGTSLSRKSKLFVWCLSLSVCSVPPERLFPVRVFGET